MAGEWAVQSEERMRYSEIGWNSALCGASVGAGMVPICDRGETMCLTEGLSSLMMEAARISETSVDNYFTRQYIPEENSELHTRRRENLKSHVLKLL
jgi:hypothetical protein